MKKSLLATALVLIAILIFSCQIDDNADTPSFAGIMGRVIIEGMQDLSMASIIAERQINGQTVSVIREIGASEAVPDSWQIFENKQTLPSDPATGDTMLAKSPDESVFATVSDINGNFELMDLPVGLYTVTASKEHTLGSVRTDVLVTSQAVTEINIVLIATGSISGTVQLESSTEDLWGTFVYAEGTSYIAGTDYFGNFTINYIPTGEYDIIFYHDGYTSAETVGVIVNGASDTPLDMVKLVYIGNVWWGDFIVEDIFDLEFISHYDRVIGDLSINGTSFFDLDPMENLTRVDGSLSIKDNSSLVSISGLNNLTVIGEELSIKRNDVLIINKEEEFEAFTKLSSLGSLSVQDNPNLEELGNLSGINSIEGNIDILGNDNLNDLSGLGNITTVGGYLNLEGNSFLTDLTGLSSIRTIGGYLKIEYNSELKKLTGLSSIRTIGGNLEIFNNYKLESIAALEELDYLGGDLFKVCNNITLSQTTATTFVNHLRDVHYFSGEDDIQGNKTD